MFAIPSGQFLLEFTPIAERISEENETAVIQRQNGKNLVLMSMDCYNAMQRILYEYALQEPANATTKNA